MNRGAIAVRAAGPWAIGVAVLVASLAGAAIRAAPTPNTPGGSMTVHATGTLEGSFLIDYRILTYGPCPEGPP